MAKRIDLFDSTYSHFTKQVLERVRKETFGQDIGQNSWTTVEEYDRFISWPDLGPEHHVLEVAIRFPCSCPQTYWVAEARRASN
jgi:hypothetical protein